MLHSTPGVRSAWELGVTGQARVSTVFGNKMKPDQLMIEARAKIVWGESSSSVRDFLTTNGISAVDADAKITAFQLERNREIRKVGIKNTVIGAAVLAAEGITVYPFYKYLDSVTYTGGTRVIIAYAIGGLYALWRLVKGLAHLLRPQSEDRSITEISE